MQDHKTYLSFLRNPFRTVVSFNQYLISHVAPGWYVIVLGGSAVFRPIANEGNGSARLCSSVHSPHGDGVRSVDDETRSTDPAAETSPRSVNVAVALPFNYRASHWGQ